MIRHTVAHSTRLLLLYLPITHPPTHLPLIYYPCLLQLWWWPVGAWCGSSLLHPPTHQPITYSSSFQLPPSHPPTHLPTLDRLSFPSPAVVVARGCLVWGLSWVVRGRGGALKRRRSWKLGEGGWVGRWEGGWIEENEAVRMRCWTLWVGGWVGESINQPPRTSSPLYPPTHPLTVSKTTGGGGVSP